MKLLDYITGDRRGKEAHRIEKEAMGDPFLAEALEGFDAVGGDPGRAVERLRRRVESRVSGRRKSMVARWSAVAAVLLLFLAIGGVFLLRPDEADVAPVLADIIPVPLMDSSENRSMDVAQATEPETQEFRPEQGETEDQSAREDIQQQAASRQELLSISEDLEIEETLFFDFIADDDSPVALSETRPAEKRADSAPSAPALPLTKTDLRVMEALQAAATPGSVQGRVVDASGEPLPGASVTLRNSEKQGTVTDGTGNFNLAAETGDILDIASIGYEPAAVRAGSLPGQVVLKESENQLNDVVVFAYGAQKRSASSAGQSGSTADIEVESVVKTSLPVQGLDAYSEYLQKNRAVLYDEAGEKVTGKVVLEFRINRNGRPTSIRVAESLTPEADREARRLLENGPDWTRAENRIRFTIEF